MTSTNTNVVKTVQPPVSLEEGMARVEGAGSPEETLVAVRDLQGFLALAKGVDDVQAKAALLKLEGVKDVCERQGWFNGRIHRVLKSTVHGVETIGPQLVQLIASVTEQLAAVVAMGTVALGKAGVRAYRFAKA
jgi:hypothetical protein